MLILGIIIGVIAAAILYVHVLLVNNEIEKSCTELNSEIIQYYSEKHGDLYKDED